LASEEYQSVYLANADEKSLCVREIGFVQDGLALFCFTDSRTRKLKQNVKPVYGSYLWKS
jgi:hypothetical protein